MAHTNRSCGTSALGDWCARPALEHWGGHGHMASKANPNCNVHYVNRLVCGTHTGRVMHMWHVATQCTNAMQQCNTKHSANLYYMTMCYKCKAGSRTLGWPWAHGKQSQPQLQRALCQQAGVWHTHRPCNAHVACCNTMHKCNATM